MGSRDEPLPLCLELLLGKERDQWQLEARFIEAAYHGNVRDIKKIAKDLDVQGHGIPVTVANMTYLGMNALHAAGGRGKLPAYQYLVEEVKMEIDKADTTRVVKFLLSRGADIDALSVLGTPLTLAALQGHASTVKILLQHNADPNKCTPHFGPLDMALRKSSVSCVKLLIQGGANVSGASPCDNPLVKAAEKGLTEAIKYLLVAGANPNVLDMFGRLPIELAAEYGTREDVEILFPFTSPISNVTNWSVDGIISHVKMEIKQLEDDNFVETRMSDLKQQAYEAFRKQDYLNASVLYTQALKMDNFDAKLLSNRSLCWLRMGNGERASYDAEECKELRPKWAKAHYRLGAAQMFMKDYDSAYDSLARALELDPESEEVEKLFWEAMELRS